MVLRVRGTIAIQPSFDAALDSLTQFFARLKADPPAGSLPPPQAHQAASDPSSSSVHHIPRAHKQAKAPSVAAAADGMATPSQPTLISAWANPYSASSKQQLQLQAVTKQQQWQAAMSAAASAAAAGRAGQGGPGAGTVALAEQSSGQLPGTAPAAGLSQASGAAASSAAMVPAHLHPEQHHHVGAMPMQKHVAAGTGRGPGHMLQVQGAAGLSDDERLVLAPGGGVGCSPAAPAVQGHAEPGHMPPPQWGVHPPQPLLGQWVAVDQQQQPLQPARQPAVAAEFAASSAFAAKPQSGYQQPGSAVPGVEPCQLDQQAQHAQQALHSQQVLHGQRAQHNQQGQHGQQAPQGQHGQQAQHRQQAQRGQEPQRDQQAQSGQQAQHGPQAQQGQQVQQRVACGVPIGLIQEWVAADMHDFIVWVSTHDCMQVKQHVENTSTA